ncbi:MAG: hypothetical protein DHS20C06_08550 [Hyphobacterium sp.]|nr:MAG: hypothetical protein DHS20C06_08550 [Hyphobacterium sp.]
MDLGLQGLRRRPDDDADVMRKRTVILQIIPAFLSALAAIFSAYVAYSIRGAHRESVALNNNFQVCDELVTAFFNVYSVATRNSALLVILDEYENTEAVSQARVLLFESGGAATQFNVALYKYSLYNDISPDRIRQINDGIDHLVAARSDMHADNDDITESVIYSRAMDQLWDVFSDCGATSQMLTVHLSE